MSTTPNGFDDGVFSAARERAIFAHEERLFAEPTVLDKIRAIREADPNRVLDSGTLRSFLPEAILPAERWELLEMIDEADQYETWLEQAQRTEAELGIDDEF